MKKIYSKPTMRLIYLTGKDSVMMTAKSQEEATEEDAIINQDFGWNDEDAASWNWRRGTN